MKKFVWIFMRSLYKIERTRLTQVKCLFEKAIQQHEFSVVFFFFLSSFPFSISHLLHLFGFIEIRQFTEKCLYDEPVSFSFFLFQKKKSARSHFSFLVRCRFSQCMQNRLPSISLTAKRRWHKNPVSWTMDRCVKQYKNRSNRW